MKLNHPFNQLEKETYLEVIENHKSYSDFNTLGLYRSLLENELLCLEDLIEIRDFAHSYFQKTFDFLQLKDPDTYLEVSVLGEELNEEQKRQRWKQIITNQEKILKNKRIKHRNFGVYGKHLCNSPICPYNGLMVKQGSTMARNIMFFHSDGNKDEKINKHKRLQKEKQNFKQNRNNLED